MTIQLRRDTAANWTTANPTLAAGQPGFETDTGRIKIGNGTTAWNSLPYRFESASSGFTHTQAVAASTWVVNHNLGRRPVVEVFSPGWVQVEAAVVHTSVNQTQISFNTPQAGQAVFE